MKKAFLFIGLLVLIIKSYGQYPNNEDGQYQDMLTPEYYNTSNGSVFKEEENKYVHFARLIPFKHPLEDNLEIIPSYVITRGFGEGIGTGGTVQHHAAIDMRVGNFEEDVIMYASIDGIINTFKDAPKYRDYLTITKNIEDSIGNILGKIVVLYCHIDLNLDSLDNILLDGQIVSKGDTISTHLYTGTLGGAHLHFEIRYYRVTDNGNEEYYYWQNSSPYTEPCSGPWSYGYWDSNIGYGFAHPDNHLKQSSTGIVLNDFEENIVCYPNPVKDILTIDFNNNREVLNYSIYNINGQIVEQNHLEFYDILKINIGSYSSGLYLIKLLNNENEEKALIKVVKE